MPVTLANLRVALETAAAELPSGDLADAVGLLAAAQARLMGRLTAPIPTLPEAGEWVTAAEVAQRFKLALSSVHELARQGRLPCRMFGRYRRFNLAEVASAVANPGDSAEFGAASAPFLSGLSRCQSR